MLPLATFCLKPEFRQNGYDEFDVADRLRQRGWVVPAYTMAPDAQVSQRRVTPGIPSRRLHFGQGRSNHAS
jgi:hypothetical protein